MSEIKKFTAKEADELSKSNQQSVEEILETIENRAGYGYRFLMIAYLPQETMVELINLGYTVSKHEDPFGVEQTKIKW